MPVQNTAYAAELAALGLETADFPLNMIPEHQARERHAPRRESEGIVRVTEVESAEKKVTHAGHVERAGHC